MRRVLCFVTGSPPAPPAHTRAGGEPLANDWATGPQQRQWSPPPRPRQQRRWSPRPRPKRTPGREAAGPAIAAVQTGNGGNAAGPTLPPTAATKATGFRSVSWVFFL